MLKNTCEKVDSFTYPVFDTWPSGALWRMMVLETGERLITSRGILTYQSSRGISHKRMLANKLHIRCWYSGIPTLEVYLSNTGTPQLVKLEKNTKRNRIAFRLSVITDLWNFYCRTWTNFLGVECSHCELLMWQLFQRAPLVSVQLLRWPPRQVFHLNNIPQWRKYETCRTCNLYFNVWHNLSKLNVFSCMGYFFYVSCVLSSHVMDREKGEKHNIFTYWRVRGSVPFISISSSPSCMPARAAGLFSMHDRTTFKQRHNID